MEEESEEEEKRRRRDNTRAGGEWNWSRAKEEIGYRGGKWGRWRGGQNIERRMQVENTRGNVREEWGKTEIKERGRLQMPY